MKLLSLDLSSKSGWAIFENEVLKESGTLEKIEILGFNVNDNPQKQPGYPQNIIDACEEIAIRVMNLINETKPDQIAIELTVKGKNRHTQRFLEWMHLVVIQKLGNKIPFSYIDPSEWRRWTSTGLTKEDKKNNVLVSKGIKRGKITRKHTSVRRVNELFGLNLKLKNQDQSDAILIGLGWINRRKNLELPCKT